MKHIDLFSGIGGFAYAADQVFGNVEHIFCDHDKFCQQVLKKHWPESEIYDDIRSITDTKRFRWGAWPQERSSTRAGSGSKRRDKIDLLTGGFPCQPFSAAGARLGTADDRYLWPEMLRVIQLTRPTWVIAENVRGLTTWNNGMVLETVCADLEASGYEVQPFIIPAVAVNAPHRRDRIWFVAYATHQRLRGKVGLERQPYPQAAEYGDGNQNVNDTKHARLEGYPSKNQGSERRQEPERPDATPSWNYDWPEVATELCGVDDGLPVGLGEFKLTKSAHRREQIKAYGNAIVPQVAMEIMQAIKGSM